MFRVTRVRQIDSEWILACILCCGDSLSSKQSQRTIIFTVGQFSFFEMKGQFPFSIEKSTCLLMSRGLTLVLRYSQTCKLEQKKRIFLKSRIISTFDGREQCYLSPRGQYVISASSGIRIFGKMLRIHDFTCILVKGVGFFPVNIFRQKSFCICLIFLP